MFNTMGSIYFNRKERKMEFMKRVLMLSIVFLLFLAACGNSEDNESESNDNNEAENTESENTDVSKEGELIELDVSANDDRDYVLVDEQIVDDEYMSFTLNEIEYNYDSEEFEIDVEITNKFDENLKFHGRDYFFDGDSIEDRGYFRDTIDSEGSYDSNILILNHDDNYDEDLGELGESLKFAIEIMEEDEDDILNRYEVEINID